MSLTYSKLILSADVEQKPRMSLADKAKLSKKVEPVVPVVAVKQKTYTEETDSETHVKIKNGELERLIPKKSSYMVDLVLGSE